MRIALIGDFSQDLDEGYKNVSHYLADALDKHHEIVRLNSKHVYSYSFWRSLLKDSPDVIHLLSQPTRRGLLFIAVFATILPKSYRVLSALRSEAYFKKKTASFASRAAIRFARIDLLFVQDATSRNKFIRLGAKRVEILRNGVDIERFVPATSYAKPRLRKSYGLVRGKLTVLHVGHLRRERNLFSLKPLIEEGFQVVVLGSLYMSIDKELIAALERIGLKLIKGYHRSVEELYKLSDCYVFPVLPGNSLSMPLSILEAMACDLPVVTTRFNAIQEAFGEGKGIYFVDSMEEITPRVMQALAEREAYSTRSLVEEYSWNAVTNRLAAYYEEIMISA